MSSDCCSDMHMYKIIINKEKEFKKKYKSNLVTY